MERAEDPAGMLNHRVRFMGLAARADLNGQCGVAIGFVQAKGRYQIALEGANAGTPPVLVKPANLEEAPTATSVPTHCASCGKCKGGDAKLKMCSACRSVGYCSQKCQAADWKSHKATCGEDISATAAPVSSTAPEHDCPICLQLLAKPVTLGCGHNFCSPCLAAALAEGRTRRCPSCRAAVPRSRQFETNLLLESLLREKDAEAYDARVASSPRVVPLPSSLPSDAMRWTVHVDFLSPASLVMLAVDSMLDSPLAGRVSEQHMVWTDDDRCGEWEKDADAGAVPRLEVSLDDGSTHDFIAPSVIVATVLEVFGDGGRPCGPVELELQLLAWPRFVRPISVILCSALWDGIICNPCMEDAIRAFQWIDRRVVGSGDFPPRERRAAIDLIVGVPCVMLVYLGSHLVQDACGALPRLKSWVQGCVNAMRMEFDILGLLQRSPHFDHCKDRLGYQEFQSMAMMEECNTARATGKMIDFGKAKNGEKNPPTWPYGMELQSEGGKVQDEYAPKTLTASLADLAKRREKTGGEDY